MEGKVRDNMSSFSISELSMKASFTIVERRRCMKCLINK